MHVYHISVKLKHIYKREIKTHLKVAVNKPKSLLCLASMPSAKVYTHSGLLMLCLCASADFVNDIELQALHMKLIFTSLLVCFFLLF